MSRHIRLAAALLTLLSLVLLATPALAAPRAVKTTVSGTVYFSEMTPISGATVNVYLANKNGVYNLMATLTTNASGWWTYEGKGGTYRFDFSATSADPQSQSLTMADGVTYALDATLASYGWLSGTVTDGATGGPIAGATVELYRRNADGSWPPLPQTTLLTGADGTYASAQILAGRYAVKADAAGYASAYYGSTPPPNSVPLLVATGASVTGVNVALTPIATSGTISGRVVRYATETPMSGAYVWFYKQNADGTWPPTSPGWGTPTHTVFTNSLGLYDSGPLPFGNYMVRFFTVHTGSQWWQYVPTVDLATVVTLGPGSETLTGIDGWFNKP